MAETIKYQTKYPSKPLANYRGWITKLIIGLGITAFAGLLTVYFLLKIYFIESGSMAPTIKKNDIVFSLRFIYWVSSPKQGDVIIFWGDRTMSPGLSSSTYVKRLVGLPGDVIKFSDGKLYVNGRVYQYPGQTMAYEISDKSFSWVIEDRPFTIPAGQMFVLGDNVSNSLDGRYFGPIPMNNLRGEVYLVLWPWDRIGPVH